MSEEAIEKAVELLADEDVRDRVAAGDFTDLSGLDLAAEETAQLQTFADEWDDVEGFGFWVGDQWSDGVKGPSTVFSKTVTNDRISFVPGQPNAGPYGAGGRFGGLRGGIV